MKIQIQVLGRNPQEVDLSIDRLEYGEPIEADWKSAILYLSGPFAPNKGFLRLIAQFEVLFFADDAEIARMIQAAVLESIVIGEFETILLQIAGKMKV